jgi:transcriptional regulator
MYQPSHFSETRPEVLHGLIGEHPLGALVTLSSAGLDANHIPFELDPTAGANGTLLGHVARANPLWRDHDAARGALVIFQGPSNYITPSWYETKRETGQVVPTYNYCVVHVHGPIVVRDDRDWLRAQVERLTRKFERTRSAPWAVGDAPADFIEKQLAAIVGIEIPIARLTGKWKVSQNRPPADRVGVAAGLATDPRPNAAAMAALVRERNSPS